MLDSRDAVRRRIRLSAALVLVASLAIVGRSQEPPAAVPLLREALPGEVWISQPTISGAIPLPPTSAALAIPTLPLDGTPPSAPGSLTAQTSGLFLLSANWTAAEDPESGVANYVYAIGSGTTPSTEADVKWWQVLLPATQIKVNLALTEGNTYYFSIKAQNGAGLDSPVVRSGPLIATRSIHGASGNAIAYTIAPTGLDATGAATSGWPAEKVAELSAFMDKMIPVLRDLYGPPASSYTVTLVRDLRRTNSAIFYPSMDAIHLGDSASYQLVTHELVHAWRRDRLVSSGALWQYDATLSGFEEGFAQAVSYDAMTEFARRHPTFGLTQQLYQSSNEWDYDFQNVPELRTTDFWSDTGGMLLYWIRYEVAAAAVAKIEREHPGFYRAFNAEFYRRINLDPYLTPTRELVKQIIQTVAPAIEGRAATAWIDRQHVFDCAIHPGRKVWLFTQHYPWTEYFVFHRTYFYETFANGSDWSRPDGMGGYNFYQLNGSTGTGTLHANDGSVVWQRALQIAPVENGSPPYGFGKDDINLTTQATHLPWPGGDAAKFVTSLSSLELYRLTTAFTAGTTTSNTSYRVVGAALRGTRGVFGGVIGATGGRIYLRHRDYPAEPAVAVTNGAFWADPSWASVAHPATQSVDTIPGMLDVTYVNAAGEIWTDVRALGFGSTSGNQALLFDIAAMTPVAPAAPVITGQPSSHAIITGQNTQFVVAANGLPPSAYQWQRTTDGGATWSNLNNDDTFSGVTTAALTIASAPLSMHGSTFRAVATNDVASTPSAPATLTVALGFSTQPASQTIAAGNNAVLSAAVTGVPAPAFQWRLDGVDIAGATGATYTLPSAQRFHAGSYTVVVSVGGNTATSAPATLAIGDPAPNNARLLNLSTRAQALTGDDVLIPGFVVTGTGNKRLLIRAVGPTLGKPPFNLAGTLADPRMRLLKRNPTTTLFEEIAANDNWSTNPNAAAITQTAADVFAFPFNDNLEAALLLDLAPGEYTVIASGVNNLTGLAIVELYDADAGTPSARLINISNRGFCGGGDQVMIPGFVVSPEGPKTFLVRVVGPTLGTAPFNVSGTMTDPKLEIYPGGASTPILTNDDWSENPDAAYTAQIAAQVSAFPLTAGSKDAALVVTLQPGSYTVVGSSAVAGGTGVVLVEIYVVP